MPVPRQVILLLTLAVTLACAVLGAKAQPRAAVHDCAGAEVQVLADDVADARSACDGARDALSFFEGLGLNTSARLVVEVVPELPEQVGPKAVGCFLERPKRILILTYSEFAKSDTWFKISVDRNMYRSLAAHEVAHALADCNFAMPRPTIQAKEYVAYVAMFATMDPNLRARALRRIPGEGFASETRINEIAYLFDPMRFGAESYRHYLKEDNGVDFLSAVLAGRALAN